MDLGNERAKEAGANVCLLQDVMSKRPHFSFHVKSRSKRQINLGQTLLLQNHRDLPKRGTSVRLTALLCAAAHEWACHNGLLGILSVPVNALYIYYSSGICHVIFIIDLTMGPIAYHDYAVSMKTARFEKVVQTTKK